MEEEYKGLLLPILVCLGSVRNHRMGWGESEVLLSLVEMLLHTRTSEQVAILRREASSALPYLLPFSPISLLPLCTRLLGHEEHTHKGFKVPTGLLETMAEPRHNLLVQAELLWVLS